jgi:hypothetical protein
MPEDASLNGDAPHAGLAGLGVRVSEMQAKLHRWAVADPGRRFDDLFNFVYDPATLIMAFDRVAGNRGARTPGVDGLRGRRHRGVCGCARVPGRSAGGPQGRLVDRYRFGNARSRSRADRGKSAVSVFLPWRTGSFRRR